MGWVDRWCLTVGDSHGGTRGGNAGGTLRVVWGLELPCIVGNGVVTRMRLWDRLGVGVGALDAANISDNFLMVSMIWAKKRAKDGAGVGLTRTSTHRLAMSVAVPEEDITGMSPLWVKTLLFLL